MAGPPAPRLRGCWSEAEVAAYLDGSLIPVRLALVDGVGSPWVMSLWFLPEDGALWCATNAQAKLVSYVEARPQCGFEIAGDAPPYRGVRGKGRAEVVPQRGEEILRRLLARYGIAEDTRLGRSLLSRVDEEVAIRIVPARMTSWDFTIRMKDAVARD